MKTHLSRILPVWKACEILGEPTVYRIVSCLIQLRRNHHDHQLQAIQQRHRTSVDAASAEAATAAAAAAAAAAVMEEQDIETLVQALFYRHDKKKKGESGSMVPLKITQTWKRWTTAKSLVLDKATFLRFFVPGTVQPHTGPQGHMGLFDCWVYAVQSHLMNNPSSPGSPGSYYYNTQQQQQQAVILIPDVLILLAVNKWYKDLKTEELTATSSVKKKKTPPPKQQPTSEDVAELAESPSVDEHDDEASDGSGGAAPGDGYVALPSGDDGAGSVEDDEAGETKEPEAPRTPSNNRETVLPPQFDHDGDDDYTGLKSEKIVWTTALLAYRIYDSYQKKGIVARDTIHRFLTDIYGEESYKEPSTRGLLNVLFSSDNNKEGGGGGGGWLHATVSELEFCRRVLDTITLSKPYVILDWIATLACNMLPNASIDGALPPSVAAYVEAMQTKRRSLCDMYDLADSRLYEIKRRFHSLVQSSSPSVIQGDPMSSATEEGGTGEEASAPASGPSSHHAGRTSDGMAPKQVITLSAFCKAVSKVNDEMGNGGFLPVKIAELVFRTGCIDDEDESSSSGEAENNNNDAAPNDANAPHWTLYHVLRFACIAVRRSRGSTATTKSSPAKETNGSSAGDPETPLLRFLFQMFQVSAPSEGGGCTKSVLTREQVTSMIFLMNELADFRRQADTSILQDDDDDEEEGSKGSNGNSRGASLSPPNVNNNSSKNMEELYLDVDAASFFGILPKTLPKGATVEKTIGKRTMTMVQIRHLVNHVLKGTLTKDQMTFDEFCQWQQHRQRSSSSSSSSSKATGPLEQMIMELRLVAAVLFGVPPSEPAIELRLIGELEARHKERYTQTELSRRGPRGTIWYLIDSMWLQKWAGAVRKASRRESSNNRKQRNNLDGGGSPSSPERDPAPTVPLAGIRELGAINNAGLLADDGSLSLRQDVRWKHDYEILPPLAWSALQAWYDGGPPIYRSVVRYISTTTSSPHSYNPQNGPRIPTENELELYPFFVTVYLCDAASAGEARPFQQNYQVSRVSPVYAMLIQLCRELEVEPKMARLWVMETEPGMLPPAVGAVGTGTGSSRSASSSNVGGGAVDDWILNLEMNIIEQRKRRGASSGATNAAADKKLVLLLELKDEESGLWPRGVDGKEWSFQSNLQKAGDGSNGPEASDTGDGVVGLYNMGNTCYLNSSIQCLSHTPIFREYFTSKAYLRDINTTNPLGHEGRLAQVSAVLINSIWKRFGNQSPSATPHGSKPQRVNAPGSYALVTAPSLTPKTFKESLGKFNEHFAGNEQHDAQELLAFLLGGLSEDLNRIVDKPYMEAPDSDGRPDQELADIWWSNHLKRELSIIVALFTGQYKSLLTCRTCKYESARFEPFSFLQLPLPEDDHLSVSLILYPVSDDADTMRYCVRVKNDGKLKHVLIALAKLLCEDEAKAAAADGADGAEGAVADDVNVPEEVYLDRAKNLVVVDLREGYISKIAPNSWTLLDLQNKETAEIPVLHVYELAPLSPSPEPPVGSSSSEDFLETESGKTKEDPGEEDKNGNHYKPPEHGFLAVAQRRSELISADFLHPFAHRVFGTPLLLRVDNMKKLTGRALYDLIAKRLRNFVPKPAQRFLYDSETSGNASKEHEDRSQRKKKASAATQHRQLGENRTTTDMEDVSAGPVPRYGFRLRLTCRDGRRCLICPWFECCIGCYIPDDDSITAVIDGDSLVVDWHFSVDLATNGFGTRSSPMDANIYSTSNSNSLALPSVMGRPKVFTTPVKNHNTCGAAMKKLGANSGAITLEDCLDSFAQEERIPEAYCSKCKDFRVQTKRMSLWRLPPIVIIHLKRFQFTQHMRRKLRDLVIFPVEGLDLSRIMAPDSQVSTDECQVAPPASDTEVEAEKGGADTNGKETGSDAKDAEDAATAATESEDTESAAASAGAIKAGSGRGEMLYDLYGVVHHQGALSGGHYVASLKSEIDGQWRLYNDAQIYEIHARDVIDSSAYILFYIRRDAAKSGTRLSDYWDVRGEGEGVTEEDMDKMVKSRSERCVIS